MIDERPEDVKQLEAFRTSTKWRVMGGECVCVCARLRAFKHIHIYFPGCSTLSY